MDCAVVYEDLEPISVIADCDCGVRANGFPIKIDTLFFFPAGVKQDFVCLTTKSDAKDNISIIIVKIECGISTADEVEGRRSQNEYTIPSDVKSS